MPDINDKRKQLLEKAKLLKDRNVIDDETYEALTADRGSLSRVMELRNAKKMKISLITGAAVHLVQFSGVTPQELRQKSESKPLLDVLDEYVDLCMKKLDEMLELSEKKKEPAKENQVLKEAKKPVRNEKIPRLKLEMSNEERAKAKKKMTALKKQVFEDYKKQLQNKEGDERIKHILDYAAFNMVEGLGVISEYGLLNEFLTPIGEKWEIDLEEGRKRMREVAAFLHNKIDKPFMEYARKNPNHSDEWYQEHFIAETDAGKYWRILESSLNEAVAEDLNKAMEKSGAVAYGLAFPKPEMIRIFEEERAKFLEELDNKEEIQYFNFASRALKPVKFEMSEMMHDPRTRKIYKNQQNVLKKQEAQQNKNINEIQIKSWMKFAKGLDTSFLSNKDLKNDYSRLVVEDAEEFQNILIETGLAERNTNNLNANKKNKKQADQAVKAKPIVFSGKNVNDILKAFEEVKDVEVGEFNGYAPDKNTNKPEKVQKLDEFVENLLDLKANAKLEREAYDQKLYDSVIEELKKEQNATALHKYLRKRTLESLASANGKLLIDDKDRDLNNNAYEPAINQAIEYYKLYDDITGKDLRNKYHEEARKQIEDKAKDAMHALTKDGKNPTPFTKTVRAIRKTSGKDPGKKKLLNDNQKFFKSSLLAPYMEGSKIFDNNNKKIQEFNHEIAKKKNTIKQLETDRDRISQNLYTASQNLKLTVDILEDTTSRHNSDKYTAMMTAIESIRQTGKGNFFETFRGTDLQELNEKIGDVTSKIDEYITYAESKKWYHMLPGSTGRTRYQNARDAKAILARMQNYRKTFDDVNENIEDTEKKIKQSRKYKEGIKRVPMSKAEIDQLLKPKTKEAPETSKRTLKLEKPEKSDKISPVKNQPSLK